MLETKKNIILTKTGAKPVLIDLFYKKFNSKMPVVIFCHGYKGYKDWGAWNLVAKEFAKNNFFFLFQKLYIFDFLWTFQFFNFSQTTAT